VGGAVGNQPDADFVMDGEVVADPSGGLSSFERIQQRPATRPAAPGEPEAVPVRFVAFDLLEMESVDLRSISLDRRRGLLADGFDFGPTVQLSEVLDGPVDELMDRAHADGWEGVIAKQRSAPYRPGRSRSWLKLKTLQRDDFIVVGWNPPQGGRVCIGALVLATRTNAGGPPVSADRVGSGVGALPLGSLRTGLDASATSDAPFAAVPNELRAARWVEPRLVCEVGFADWTSSGHVRHPRFLGLRPDKSVDDVTREAVITVALSNLDKILFTEIEGTKRGMVDHYALVAEKMLAEVANRPLVLERFPNGIEKKGFYQKNTPDHVPDYISRLRVPSRSQGEIVYSVVHDANGLVYLANQGAIVMHTLLSSAADPDQPIEIIWDLDPSSKDLGPVQLGARLLRDRLTDLGLDPRVKSSGGKGLHIHVDVTDAPGAGVGFPATRAFAERVAWELVAEHPDVFTLEFAKKDRKGRLLICLLYTSPSPRDRTRSRMPSSA